uniref:Uncharacterized protein n=1 Tax=Anguilla anguilla TaxID=7936 RepID=A0A0E9UR18_ANGAN
MAWDYGKAPRLQFCGYSSPAISGILCGQVGLNSILGPEL